MTTYQPYTYLIGWSERNVYYYGVRFGKKCNPNDLWKTYFTSSKHVKSFYKEHGHPDLIQIRKVFDSSEQARLWESKVLRRMGVTKKQNWLNKTDNVSISPECCSHVCTEQNKLHFKKIRTGHKESEETKNKKRLAMIGKNVGKRNTDEQRKRKSEAHKSVSYKQKYGDRWLEEIEKRRKKKPYRTKELLRKDAGGHLP